MAPFRTMGCFSFFERKKSQSIQEQKSANTRENVFVPASHSGASRSDGSVSGKQIVKSSGSSSSQNSFSAIFDGKPNNLRVFDLSELRSATDDFNRTLKIGEGGFGSVFKGFIRPAGGERDKIAVAVKKLNQHGLQGHKQWLAEVQFLGVVEHKNLVKLSGYCAEDGERGIQRLLVYEFMPNKTLDDHLFNRAYPPLIWKVRLEIALGAAEGLAYLHEGLEVQVIYRDFKASNVLLDNEFRPKLSDFGLAREGPIEGRTHVSTAVVGTYGYADPDYIKTGHLTVKSDVWGFGVVLYEILTGRRTLDRNRPRGEQKLLDWVKQYPTDGRKFSMIMDPKLRDQFSLKAAREIGKLADHCLTKNSKERPKMSEVVESLKKAIQLSETRGSVEANGPSRR